MAVVKVIEVLAQSNEGWEAAVKDAVSESKKSLRNITSVYCKEFQAVVENDEVVMYRVTCKISFLVES